jgi:hypothetical protein
MIKIGRWCDRGKLILVNQVKMYTVWGSKFAKFAHFHWLNGTCTNESVQILQIYTPIR